MERFHPLLARQWRRHAGPGQAIPEEWRAFLQTVSSTYDEFDSARFLSGRALELSSEELHSAVEELRGVLDALPDFLFRVRADDRITSVRHGGSVEDHPVFWSLLKSDFTGNPLPVRQFWIAVHQVRASRTPAEFVVATGSPGQESFHQVRILPFVEQDIIGVIRDITAEKRAEQNKLLLEQERHQAQKMESLGSLAGGVAHDFNNMLSGIMGYADLLLAEELDARRLNYLQAIVQAASRSAALTQNLLAFARKGKNLAVSLELPVLVKDCLELLRPAMSPDLQVVIAMDGCPTVDGDPSQINQVIMNLCLNAMEEMPSVGTLSISATVRAVPDPSQGASPLAPGTYVDLSVSDTGPGMTEAIKLRIFEPFFTTKPTTSKAGAGMGLATAYGIVQAHQGEITVDTCPGKGSRFHVVLPVGKLALVPKPAMVPLSRGRGTILLAEDEVLLRQLGVEALELLGYEVLSVGDGEAAVETFRVSHPHLSAVLLDLRMPRMGGKEAYPLIKGINPRVPVIICTGYGENEEVQELLTSGAACLIAKPYRIADLAAKLQQVITL